MANPLVIKWIFLISRQASEHLNLDYRVKKLVISGRLIVNMLFFNLRYYLYLHQSLQKDYAVQKNTFKIIGRSINGTAPIWHRSRSFGRICRRD